MTNEEVAWIVNVIDEDGELIAEISTSAPNREVALHRAWPCIRELRSEHDNPNLMAGHIVEDSPNHNPTGGITMPASVEGLSNRVILRLQQDFNRFHKAARKRGANNPRRTATTLTIIKAYSELTYGALETVSDEELAPYLRDLGYTNTDVGYLDRVRMRQAHKGVGQTNGRVTTYEET